MVNDSKTGIPPELLVGTGGPSLAGDTVIYWMVPEKDSSIGSAPLVSYFDI